VLGYLTVHGVEGLIPYSVDTVKLAFIKGLFEILRLRIRYFLLWVRTVLAIYGLENKVSQA